MTVIKPLVSRKLKRIGNRKGPAEKVRTAEASKIAVVALHLPEEFSESLAFVKMLRHRGHRQVDFFIGFQSKNLMSLYAPTLKDFPFCPTDFAWNGRFLSPELQHALSQDYDLLIDLSHGQSAQADAVIAKTRARWKAGHDNGRNHLFDFMISGQCTHKELIAHITTYFLTLNNSK